MSRVGRRARRERLEAEGLWVAPARKVAPLPPPREIQVAIAMQADRAEWVEREGTRGWEAEQCRRRAARIAASRTRRLAVLWRGDRRRAA